MEVLVLAGGLSDRLPVPRKADLIIGGRRMVDYVTNALQAVPEISSVRVVRGESDCLVTNLMQALETMKTQENDYILIASCDIPFLTPESVTDFLHNCEPGYDLYYPIVRREACEKRFPGIKRTYAKLREGTFTGGNLFLVRASKLPRLKDRLTRVFQNRKSPLKLSREFGFGVTVSFLASALFGSLSVAKLEREVERVVGIKPKAVFSEYAEIGTDIDKLSDLALIEQLVTNTKEVI
jgi:hypothetical protein